MGTESPVFTRTPTYYLRFKMQPNSELQQAIPPEMNAFLYTLAGTIHVGEDGEKCNAHTTVVLSKGDSKTGVVIKASDAPAEFPRLSLWVQRVRACTHVSERDWQTA